MRIDSRITAERISSALKASEKSQVEIGSILGINQSRISRYRKGRFVRYSGGVKKLCELLDVKPHFLSSEFDPTKHPELMEALGAAIRSSPKNAHAVTALLKAAAQFGQVPEIK